MTRLRERAAALAGLTALVGSLVVVGSSAPAQANEPTSDRPASCFDPHDVGAGAAAKGVRQRLDHRQLTARQQAAIEKRTNQILAARKGRPGGGGTSGSLAGAVVPVYVHVMADARGNGNVTDSQISQQIAVLNRTYAGAESGSASNTGFTFTLAGRDRYFNTRWHQDNASASYRSQTRRGGADALNIWLVDSSYLGVATFPWDYAKNPGVDGIRVQYSTLPGGSQANYNLGKTATHETGHWFGLYHTFQGGCTPTNDEVSDTPAQSSATNGCPQSRDSCSLPGLDPIHNYMDYSFDSCYTQFTPDQTTRMHNMFAAYRA